MATREEARQKREERLDELHKKLTGAVEQLVTGEDWADALRFAARFRSRSFNNVLLIWEQHQAAFEQGRVPEPFRRVQTVAAARPAGREGPAGVSDPRPRHGQVRVREPVRPSFLVSPESG